uniref:Uncharacterized protein n=1 Tax=Setaria italica TaxID=4555 RepID=K4A3Y6_SETIT
MDHLFHFEPSNLVFFHVNMQFQTIVLKRMSAGTAVQSSMACYLMA